VIELGLTVCNVPSERYEHGAVAFQDGLMYVYGGYSQRCGDYCDDLWAFDIALKTWLQVYSSGRLSKLYSDIGPSGISFDYTNDEVPRDNSTNHWAGPGSRWKHSMVVGSPFNSTDGTAYQTMVIFGGHRLWQGFSSENSENNNWSNLNTLPKGGYLNDLWIYVKQLDFSTVPGSGFRGTVGRWKKLSGTCELSCENVLNQPFPRASHGSAFDSIRNLIWIHGGYHAYFPYLSTDGVGAGPGLSSSTTKGFVPYPVRHCCIALV
jgi:hypothetical protein